MSRNLEKISGGSSFLVQSFILPAAFLKKDPCTVTFQGFVCLSETASFNSTGWLLPKFKVQKH